MHVFLNAYAMSIAVTLRFALDVNCGKGCRHKLATGKARMARKSFSSPVSSASFLPLTTLQRLAHVKRASPAFERRAPLFLFRRRL